ncbi:uncharacterized protein LOC110024244 [Phalaenopsis equestris]|uniref:uncharacterized protein LOC110024244 n=1 Tax=Phalaenopsis equestris TaxID=78828 RepID=UPI0009E30755|nr:uncharacterized protein LOC110024244 [Phalaenopsis equestris]
MRVYPANALDGGSKRLRRLPHVFSKMIELPFGADADVYIEEEPSMFRFFVSADGVSGGVRAHAVAVHPGVMKVVVLNGAGTSEGDFGDDELEFDRWRFRLPHSALPGLATAEYVDGVLIVTVPKGVGTEERNGVFVEENGDFSGSAAYVV